MDGPESARPSGVSALRLKAFALAALVCALPSTVLADPPPPATKLQYVADQDTAVIFFAPSTATRTPEGVDVWVARLNISPVEVSGRRIAGAWIYQRFDCKAGTFAPLELAALDLNLTAVYATNPEPTPRPVPKGTPNELLFKHLCAKAAIGSGQPVQPDLQSAVRFAQARGAGEPAKP